MYIAVNWQIYVKYTGKYISVDWQIYIAVDWKIYCNRLAYI